MADPFDDDASNTAKMRHRLAEIEPAVPRCATCKHFEKYQASKFNVDLDAYEYPERFRCGRIVSTFPVPQDGTGYCHLHEAKR